MFIWSQTLANEGIQLGKKENMEYKLIEHLKNKIISQANNTGVTQQIHIVSDYRKNTVQNFIIMV